MNIKVVQDMKHDKSRNMKGMARWPHARNHHRHQARPPPPKPPPRPPPRSREGTLWARPLRVSPLNLLRKLAPLDLPMIIKPALRRE